MTTRSIDRRILSSSLSARVISYLVGKSFTQAEIARMLGVSEPYISLVKSRERALTLDHLERLSSVLQVRLGELMIAITEPKGAVEPRRRRINEITAELIRKCDGVREAILSDSSRLQPEKQK